VQLPGVMRHVALTVVLLLPRCTDRRGFHHGLGLAMPCGTIRNYDRGVDVVLGHVQRVYVDPGNRVRRGMPVARAGKLAAPDRCHLHLEVRPVGAGYADAVRPHPYLMLERRVGNSGA